MDDHNKFDQRERHHRIGKGRYFLVFIVLVLCLCVCAASTLGIMSVANSSFSSITSREILSGDVFNQIAVIDVSGEIIGGESSDIFGTIIPDPVAAINHQLEAAVADSTVKGIIVRFNTGGGTVYDSFQIADKVRKLDAGTDKPIVALVETSAASGGYLIASQTDMIIANQTSIVGSIGVISQIQDTEELFAKLGIKNITITSDGAEKKAGNDLDDPDSPAYQDLKQLLNDYQAMFERYVAEGRAMPNDEVKKLADGSIFSGNRAIAAKLVDRLGDLEAAVEEVKTLGGITVTPRVVEYKAEANVGGLPGLINRLIPASVQSLRNGLVIKF